MFDERAMIFWILARSCGFDIWSVAEQNYTALCFFVFSVLGIAGAKNLGRARQIRKDVLEKFSCADDYAICIEAFLI